ncbi:DUF3850 domain-containing protein [Herbiconiux sp. YIM B11900]|uniref:DUF3850 domain-containing protein n=1 Tax=Herbiconiux sp. YIM B11900 TaxID=3404131 RepID=UPI003F832B8D
MSTVHELKSWPEFFQALVAGVRSHELRQNDRNFVVGDLLQLREYDPVTSRYTGAECVFEVRSITSAEFPCAVSAQGLADGFCIMSVSLMELADSSD